MLRILVAHPVRATTLTSTMTQRTEFPRPDMAGGGYAWGVPWTNHCPAGIYGRADETVTTGYGSSPRQAGTRAKPSEYAVDVEFDAPRAARGGGHGEDEIEPRQARVARREPHGGAEVVLARIDFLTARQALQHCGRSGAQALAAHLDERAAVLAQRVVRVDRQRAVLPLHLPVGAAAQH